ncbi:MAG: prepilin-type N-terminal cleavage/methylation domain-containing protein [Actinobacteria bacterium]|nr:prepilin-type N-terminal cleavage/methylation domain-containing protein [Actinomycetota bacterium]
MIKIYYTKNQKGFSLIEMMVVVVILGLITLGLVTFFTGGAKSWVAGQSQLKAQREARQAIDTMVREIREASNIIANSTTSIEINFNTPWNANLKYSWSGIKWESILKGTNTLINNIQSLNFKYFDNSEPPVEIIPLLTSETASKISKVNIDLKVDIDKDSNPDITLNTDVNLRNYGLPK